MDRLTQAGAVVAQFATIPDNTVWISGYDEPDFRFTCQKSRIQRDFSPMKPLFRRLSLDDVVTQGVRQLAEFVAETRRDT
jgi:hypothetical protein